MAVRSDRIEHEIVIAAPPEQVFEFLTVPEKYTRWMGREATLDPRAGGVYRCVVHDAATVRGEYLTVEPPTCVAFTWGFEGNPRIPPGSSTVTITLEPVASGTRLLLVHAGLPHPDLALHDRGWQGYLAQLAGVAA
jgi:uncharacterized protein YndB with AHSA1/START domain